MNSSGRLGAVALLCAVLAGCQCGVGMVDDDGGPLGGGSAAGGGGGVGGGAGGTGGAGGSGGGGSADGGGGDIFSCSMPLTCAKQGFNCGPAGDGCGALLNCGTCTAPETCGATSPGVCGQGVTTLPDGGVNCVPLTCAGLGFNCGPAGDGCGRSLNCGTCNGQDSCGGGGTSGVCGRPACTPKTCAQLDAGCGVQGDGCGGATPNCGTCTAPAICGGAGVLNHCGALFPDAGADAGRPCTNLCLQQNACDAGVRTSVSGTVFAPTDPALYGAADPLSGAFVYVPNAAVQPFSPGVACEKCSASVSGDPLVSTTTAVNGTFVLHDVPCGANIPLVIQLGRWRRQISIPNVACCGNTALTAAQTRLPRTQGEGHPNDNIPLFAVTTGSADNLECILPKIGIAASEFTKPTGTGRVRMYRDNGVNPFGGLPAATTLYNTPGELAKYDVVIADCVGSEQTRTTAQRSNIESYANGGGRMFTSHFGYVWLYDQPAANSFTATATWNPGQANPPDQDGYIDVSFVKGQTFAQWIAAVNAQAVTSTPAVPRIRVNTVRRDFDAVNAPAERWVFGTRNGSAVAGNNPAIPLQYAFNTPLAAAQADKCGRVLFSDFHVSSGGTFPNCTAGPMTPQEKVFEYLIFDLTSCVTPYTVNCGAKSCSQLGFNCGPAGDGCGGLLNCGTCTLPQTCGGAGQPGVCGGGCMPRTCAAQGFTCGPAGDGCGGQLNCGACPTGQVCGGGGAGICGAGGCAPTSCAAQGFNCGPAGNGCGGLLDCGTCGVGETCGAGGAGKCGPSIN